MPDYSILNATSTTIPNILMPLPNEGFDPTEASIPWREFHSGSWQITISTEHGIPVLTDQNRLHGRLPGLIGA
jgi:hypothetical protein